MNPLKDFYVEFNRAYSETTTFASIFSFRSKKIKRHFVSDAFLAL